MAEITLDQAMQLALQLHQANRLAEARQLYQQILDHQPNHGSALHMLGVLTAQMGDSAAAIELIQRAMPLIPHEGLCHSNLGKIYFDRGAWEQSEAACRAALRINGQLAEAHYNLGNALYAQRGGERVDEAIVEFAAAIALRPDYLKAHHNLANALKDRGQLDEAVAALRRALAIRSIPETHSNLIFTMMFHPQADLKAILAECRRWNERFVVPLRPERRPHENRRDADRPLRIGYVSPDFREHCQALFMVPLLENHDRTQFHITAYSDVRQPDAVTTRLQKAVGQWRNIAGQPDARVAELIRADQIDILIDLTMHMANHRLLVFARQPAPVQIAWLAYPGTTGVETMDYRFTDPFLDPVSPSLGDERYSETSIRLPETFWCYDALTASHDITPLPAKTAGYITFGCLNNPCKLHMGVLEAWAQILQAVPASRLILMAAAGVQRRRVGAFFTRHNVDLSRITFVGHRPRAHYLQTYRDIDIALDTFPVNGHTTSLDALFMGVPVVTLATDAPLGRAGLCQLSHLGLSDLVARDAAGYVQIAVTLANDLSRLAELRQTLRPRMESSPLMDAPRFSRHMESVFRDLWKRHCAFQKIQRVVD